MSILLVVRVVCFEICVYIDFLRGGGGKVCWRAGNRRGNEEREGGEESQPPLTLYYHLNLQASP